MPDGPFIAIVQYNSTLQWMKAWDNDGVRSITVTVPAHRIILSSDMTVVCPVIEVLPKDNEKPFKLPFKQKTYYVPQQHVRTRQFKRGNSKYHR